MAKFDYRQWLSNYKTSNRGLFEQKSTGSASTGSASTGSASTGSASTGSAATGSAATGSAAKMKRKKAKRLKEQSYGVANTSSGAWTGDAGGNATDFTQGDFDFNTDCGPFNQIPQDFQDLICNACDAGQINMQCECCGNLMYFDQEATGSAATGSAATGSAGPGMAQQNRKRRPRTTSSPVKKNKKSIKEVKRIIEQALGRVMKKKGMKKPGGSAIKRKAKKTRMKSMNPMAVMEQSSQLNVNNIPDINITGPQSVQITWSGVQGVGPVYISLVDVGTYSSMGEIAVIKTGGDNYSWNINCSTATPSEGIAQIFVAKMPQGYVGPYDPYNVEAYNYSNNFNFTNSCGGGPGVAPVKDKIGKRGMNQRPPSPRRRR